MDPTLPSYVGFFDGASRWSPNLASAARVIYSPLHEFLHLDGVCVSAATNNQDAYDEVIGLLISSLHFGICYFNVFL